MPKTRRAVTITQIYDPFVDRENDVIGEIRHRLAETHRRRPTPEELEHAASSHTETVGNYRYYRIYRAWQGVTDLF